MPGNPTRLSTVARAYASGRAATLRPPTPHRAWQTAEALRGASPEVQAAWAAGMAADPRMPMPGAGQLMAAVVGRLVAS